MADTAKLAIQVSSLPEARLRRIWAKQDANRREAARLEAEELAARRAYADAHRMAVPRSETLRCALQQDSGQ